MGEEKMPTNKNVKHAAAAAAAAAAIAQKWNA